MNSENYDSVKFYPPREINGIISIPGDKVTSVHLLLAALIVPTETKIDNIHYCGDVNKIIDWILLNKLASISFEKVALIIKPIDNKVLIDLSQLSNLRSNICLVSALALKYGKVIYKGVGGCSFVDRMVDKHFSLMEEFGLKFEKHESFLEIKCNDLIDSVIFDCATNLYGPSVGVTCHALIASLVYRNSIILNNISLESAPLKLIEYIKKSTKRPININGRVLTIGAIDCTTFKSSIISVPPDITVACTYIGFLMSIGNGRLYLEKISISDFPESILKIYKEIEIFIKDEGFSTILVMVKKSLQMPRIIVCDVIPGFPSDVAPIVSASVGKLDGKLIVIDHIYDKRSSHVEGLNKMGYNFYSEGNKVVVTGVFSSLVEEEIVVEATDIRAGAALIIGALGSSAKSVTINNYYQIYRGYSNLISTLENIGVELEKLKKD